MVSQPEDLVAELAAAYDLVPPIALAPLEHAGLNNKNVGLQTGAGTFIVRVYESLSYADPTSFEYEQQVLTWLAAQRLSFRVPVPHLTRDGRPAYQGARGWTGLTPKLPGTPLALQAHDGESLGAVTGELQVALRQLPPAPRPGRPLFGDLFRFPDPSLDPLTLTPAQVGLPSAPHDQLFGLWREEAARLQAFVDGPYRALPRQVCHNDVTTNNVLAEDGTVTAVLDFEYVTPTARALDFATGLRIVMPYWQDPEPWPPARAYCRGYARRVTLADEEIEAIPDLLRLRAAITVLWWIGRAAATGTAGPLASRMQFFQEISTWLHGAEPALMDVVRAELRPG